METLWAQTFALGKTAQWAELIAIIKVLQLAKGDIANTYTDSRYTFATAHVHGVIYKERGLLTEEGKQSKIKVKFWHYWKPHGSP